MIRNLSYENFMEFFFDKRNFFNQKILTPISSDFSDDLRKFLKKCSGWNMRTNFKYRAAYTTEYDINRLQYISNKNNYDIVRDRLPEQIPFKHCDISTVYQAMQYNVQKYGPNYFNHKIQFADTPAMHANFTEKYDLILLSNIFSYLYSDSYDVEDRLTHMHRNILTPLIANNTTENGRVYFHYAWGEKNLPWVNFLHYYQSQRVIPTEMVARTVDRAYKDYVYDVVLYATHRQK